MPRSGLGEAKQEKANIDQVWERQGRSRQPLNRVGKGNAGEGKYLSGFEKSRPGYFFSGKTENFEAEITVRLAQRERERDKNLIG